MLRRLVPGLLLLACNPGTAPATTDQAAAAATTDPAVIRAPHGDPWTVATLGSLGEQAAIVAVVRPARWPTLHAHLAALPLPRDVADRLTDPTRWLAVFLDELGPAAAPDTPRPALAPLDLAAWDRTRPVIVALGAVAVDLPTGLLAAHLTGPQRPGVRHEFVLPAGDPAALAAALARAFTPLGAPRPALVAQHPGASAWSLGARDTLAVLPGDRLVRVILDVGAIAPDAAPVTLDLSPRPAARMTAGVLALASDDTAGLLLRPHRLPPLTLLAALREISDDLGDPSPAEAARYRRSVLRELLACERKWGAEPLEVDDYAVSLAADDRGLFARAVVSLTPRGDAAVTAGIPAGSTPLALVRPAVADAWMRFDAVAASASTGTPVSPLTADVILDAGSACGPLGWLVSPTAPFASLPRMVVGMAGDGLLPTSQTAVDQIAITDVAARQGGVASLTAPSPDLETARAPFDRYGALVEATVEVEVAREGERERVRAGFNLAPAAVFGAPAPQDGLAHVRADLGAFASLLPDVVPKLAHTRLTGAARRDGRALVADLALTSSDPPARPIDFTAVTWDPLPAAEPRCAQDYARGLSGLLAPFVDGIDIPLPPTADAALADLAALKPAIACIAATTDASRLHALAVDTLADSFLDLHDPVGAARILAAACKDGLADACTRNERLAAARPPILPIVEMGCPGRIEPSSSTLAISPAGATLDGVPFTDPEALRALDHSVALAVDETLPFDAVRPHLVVLARTGLRLTVLARTASAAPPVHLPLAAPTLVESAGYHAFFDPTIPAHRITFIDDEPKVRSEGESADPQPFLRRGDPPPRPHGKSPRVLSGTVRVRPALPSDEKPLGLSGPVRVDPGGATSWGAVAAALARSCDGATLITSTVPDDEPPDPTTKRPAPATKRPAPAAKRTGGTLDPDIVRGMVLARMDEVRDCYDLALTRDPNARGRITVEFTIDSDGDVKEATVSESNFPDSATGTCIADAVARWWFPRHIGGGTAVTYPFVLEPG